MWVGDYGRFRLKIVQIWSLETAPQSSQRALAPAINFRFRTHLWLKSIITQSPKSAQLLTSADFATFRRRQRRRPQGETERSASNEVLAAFLTAKGLGRAKLSGMLIRRETVVRLPCCFAIWSAIPTSLRCWSGGTIDRVHLVPIRRE
jgi:hypothetical protein